ncbi:MAG: hypothetical protein RL367_2456 [Pseudomonadota bacterium]
MMQVSKRQFLGGSAALGAAMVVTPARASARPVLALYDSRIADSRAYAQSQRALGVSLIDVVHQEQTQWRMLRGHDAAGRVVGMTSWADWVAISSHLGERGMRVVTLERQPVAHAALFRWELTSNH